MTVDYCGGTSAFGLLRDRILDAISDSIGLTEPSFQDLALAVFRYQFENNPVYSHFCELAGMTDPKDYMDFPAMPTSAFKRAEIRAFPAEQTVAWFQTSGTTGGTPGKHFFPTLELYEKAIAPNFRLHLMHDATRMRMLVLTPPPVEAPHSSLVHMMHVVMHGFGTEKSRYYVRADELLSQELEASLGDCCSGGEPTFLLGTAFALAGFVRRMEEIGRSWQLPTGSRIMETGGFKGRGAEIPRAEFHARLAALTGIPPSNIVNEYGMTELSSQFYDTSFSTDTPTPTKSFPPWTRVMAVDPLSGRPSPAGCAGLLRIIDLANLGSVAAIQTEDVGVCHDDGFEVIGRVEGASMRGCSLDSQHML